MEIYATELMGAKAYDAQGHFVGRVREFFIEPADQPNRISHYLLSRGHFPPLVARHDQVASVEAGTLRLTQLDLNDVKVRLYGDIAVVTSRVDLHGKNGERDISGRYRYTRVYNRRFGQWKIVSFEASRMNDR